MSKKIAVATQVHELLLNAHPQNSDANLVKAAEISETSPSSLQKQTLAAIRKLRAAIDKGASADERQELLREATSSAEAWATSPAEQPSTGPSAV